MARPCKVPDRAILRAAEYYVALGTHCGRRVRTSRGHPQSNEIGLIDLLASEFKVSKPVIHRVLRRGPRSGAPLPALPIGFERGMATTPVPKRPSDAHAEHSLARIGLRASAPTPAAVTSAVTARTHLMEALDWALSDGGFSPECIASAEALLARLRAQA